MARKQITQTGQMPSWGLAAGLLAGCGVTLIGITLGLPPITILGRALGGGSLVALIVTLLTFGWQMLSPPKEED